MANLDPVEVAVLRPVDDVAATVEAEDVVADAARSSRLLLVFVTEQFLAGEPSSVVEVAVGEDAEERALAGVYVPDHGHSATTQTQF